MDTGIKAQQTTPSRLTNRQLLLEAECIVMGKLGIDAVYYALKAMRDEYEAAIAERDGRILELERKLSICNEYADKVREEKREIAEQYYRLRAGLPEKDGNE